MIKAYLICLFCLSGLLFNWLSHSIETKAYVSVCFSFLAWLFCGVMLIGIATDAIDKAEKKVPDTILRMDADAFNKEVTNGCTIYTAKDGSVKVLFDTEHPAMEKDK